ncbi:hypothetical protein LINPERPRIM_LOCUS25361 [Linum perenne]
MELEHNIGEEAPPLDLKSLLIEDLERSSGKRLIDGKPGMAGERGGAGGGQASIWAAASRRSLIGGVSVPLYLSIIPLSDVTTFIISDSGRMLIHGSSASNKKRKMQKLQAENQAAMQAAWDLHRKK